ncbi:peptidoglycan-binding domain-containing protein [Pseudooceanicola onchidii]|uniref:peptidoglycan-binding domain-containing protein n=1 Tax=Pseudooceanicola onchidii TaxID=2562279 RepID=UPI0010AA47B3|nr:peptidoglycan-binding domain-containing protein [Pseudooceanicola onchidii]
MIRSLVTLAFCALATHAGAVDQNDRYAVKGPGKLKCGTFAALDPTHEHVRDAGVWLTGYFTAHNRLLRETYDLLPWQTPGTVLALAAQYCRAHPEAQLNDAAAELVGYMASRRVTEEAPGVVLRSGGSVTVVYAPIVEDIRDALREAGQDLGPDAEDLEAALKLYQQAQDLPVTGIPDQPTLLKLLADR